MSLGNRETEHSISVRFVEEMDRMGRGEITLDEMIALVDEVAAEHPGDDRQQRFYGAVRSLARKVATGVSDD